VAFAVTAAGEGHGGTLADEVLRLLAGMCQLHPEVFVHLAAAAEELLKAALAFAESSSSTGAGERAAPEPGGEDPDQAEPSCEGPARAGNLSAFEAPGVGETPGVSVSRGTAVRIQDRLWEPIELD
jgi:hypothetical protein